MHKVLLDIATTCLNMLKRNLNLPSNTERLAVIILYYIYIHGYRLTWGDMAWHRMSLHCMEYLHYIHYIQDSTDNTYRTYSTYIQYMYIYICVCVCTYTYICALNIHMYTLYTQKRASQQNLLWFRNKSIKSVNHLLVMGPFGVILFISVPPNPPDFPWNKPSSYWRTLMT